MEWSEEYIIKLIDAYREKSLLWNPQHKDHFKKVGTESRCLEGNRSRTKYISGTMQTKGGGIFCSRFSKSKGVIRAKFLYWPLISCDFQVHYKLCTVSFSK
nr:unnamed protein product [Callosobruchus chinensis]